MINNITIPKDMKLTGAEGMPEDLQGHVKAALINGSQHYKCDVKDLVWKVKFDKKSKLPYITVNKK